MWKEISTKNAELIEYKNRNDENGNDENGNDLLL